MKLLNQAGNKFHQISLPVTSHSKHSGKEMTNFRTQIIFLGFSVH
jgi:hypothetical protein